MGWVVYVGMAGSGSRTVADTEAGREVVRSVHRRVVGIREARRNIFVVVVARIGATVSRR